MYLGKGWFLSNYFFDTNDVVQETPQPEQIIIWLKK